MRLVEVEIVMHAYMIAVCNLQSSDEVFMSQIECIFFLYWTIAGRVGTFLFVD